MINQLSKNLEKVFEELITVLDGLSESLKVEREAIVEFDLKKINSVFKQKTAQINKAQSLQHIQKEALSKLAKSLDIRGVPTFKAVFDKLPDKKYAQHLQDRFSCVKSLAQAVQELNETQRQYLAYSIHQIQSSLQITSALKGQANTESCYDKNGHVGASKQKKANALMNRSF